jgi:antitoxin MazE
MGKVMDMERKVSLPDGIGSDFMDSLSKVMKDYDETLKGLKDR